VSDAKCGDRDAMRDLYVGYADRVHSHVKRIVNDRHDAEDLTQQVFAKLLTELPRYEPREVPFKAWVLRVAHNMAIDHLRRSRSVPCEEVRSHDVHADQAAHDCRTSLRDALSTLPAEQRNVLLLRHLVGLSPQEIAERLGKSLSSVNGLHYRGRAAARLALNDLDSGPATAAPIAERRWTQDADPTVLAA